MTAIAKDLDKANTQVNPKAVQATLAPSLVSYPFELAESGARAAFGVANDLRAEIKSLADSSIDYAEEVTKGVLRAGRKLSTRVEQVSASALNQSETLLLSTIASLKRIGTNTVSAVGDSAVAVTGGSKAAA